MSKRKVLMIDDHAMVREGVRLLLDQRALDCELLEAGSWSEAQELLARHADLAWVLLDLGLPDAVGLVVLDQLRRERPELPVVVLSGSEERALVLDCINRGALGFIGKSSSSAVLADALRLVFAGGIYLPPALIAQGAPSPENAGTTPVARRAKLTSLGLTPRQIDVLELLVRGLSNKAIAEQLALSEATVKTHVAAGLRALNVKNRTQVVFTLASWGHLGKSGSVPHA